MRKKILSIFIAFAMIISLVGIPAFAETTSPTVELKASQTTVVKGNNQTTVVISALLHNPKPEVSKVSGISFVLKSNNEKLKLEEKATSLATEFGSESATYNSPKFTALKLNGFNAAAISEAEVTLMTIEAKFDADAPVGKYTLTTEEMKVADTKANALYSGNPTVSIELVSEITGVQAITGVTAPVKNAAPVNTVNAPAGTTASIKWYSVKDGKDTELSSGNFAGDTVYKAVINVNPNEYYQFADNVKFTVDGENDWTAAKQQNGSYNLIKTFSKTASKSIEKIEVTKPPTKKIYTHGDKFNTGGMSVKVTYDDNTVNTEFKDYTVLYATEGKNYLKKDDTKVTLKAGEKSVDVTGLTVGAKALTITGLKATDRQYDGTKNVALTGGQLTGAVAGEDVSVTMPSVGTITDANIGVKKKVTVTKPSLEGADNGNYSLSDLSEITVDITKAGISDVVLDAITGYKGTYDGTEHNAVVIGDNASGYTVKYKTTENGEYETTVPKVKNASEMGQAVMLEISKDNYKTVYKSVTAVVSPKQLTATDLSYSGTITREYNGTTACDLTQVNGAGVNSETVTVKGTAAYDDKNVGTGKTVTFKAARITSGNYRLEAGTELKINNAAITATGNYKTDSKYHKQNAVVGIGTFTDPEFVSDFEENVTGTFSYSCGELNTKEAIENALKKKKAGETATISYTFTPNDSNYTGTKTGEITVTMIDIEFKIGGEAATIEKAVTVKNGNPVYGTSWADIIALNNNIKANVGEKNIEGTYSLSVDKSAVPDAGTASYNVVFNSKDGQYKNVNVFTAGADIAVSKKALTVIGAKATDRQYDNTTVVTVTGGALSGVITADKADVTLSGTISGTIANADAGNKKAVTVTGYTISGGKAKNYELAQPTDVTVNIAKKELSLKSVTVNNKTFDGTTEAVVTKVEFGEAAPLPETSGYTATAEFKDANVGTNKDVTVKVVLNDANYSLKEKTVAAKADITKATLTIPTQKLVLKAGDKTGQTIDFAKLMPSDAGNLTYTNPAISGDEVIDTQKAEFKDGVYKFALNENAAANKTQKIKTTIKSDNYADIEVTAEVKTTDKAVPAVTAENITVEYTGNPVSKDLIKGTHSVDGTFDWAVGVTAPTKAGSGSYEVTFTPADSSKYEAITKTIKVTIKPAKVTGTLTFDKVTAAESTLNIIKPSDFSQLSPSSGTFVWNDGDAQIIEQGKPYGWTFTPDDKNYAVLEGTVIPWAASGGSGGILPPPQVAEKPEITVDNAQGKVELSADGTTATITPNDGYEIDKVTINGKEVTAVDNKLTGLKTGDKVVVTFKEKTAPEPGFDVQKYVSDLKLVARSSKTAKGNVKVRVASVKDQNGKTVDLADLKDKGYTVKYKFYRSDRIASKYTAKVEKTISKNSYVNTTGKKGTKYFYKVRVMVYDNDGKLVAKSALKQCKYTSRTWTK